jgi:WD40 repeat protein
MPASATDIDFSPGGGILATAGSDKLVRLWNTSTGKPAGVLEGHKKNVTDITFNYNNGNLASASTDGTIKLWKGSNGALIDSFETHAAYSISFVGNLLASGGCPEPGAFSCETGDVRLYRIK